MKEEQLTVYTTCDGRKFFNKKEAKIHEDMIRGTKYYRVYYDLNKGVEQEKIGYIICTATLDNELWVEGWLYEQFGNKVSIEGIIKPIVNWRFSEVEYYSVDENKILTMLYKG